MVDVCEDGGKHRGIDDGSPGVQDGDDIRGVQIVDCCKHTVGVDERRNHFVFKVYVLCVQRGEKIENLHQMLIDRYHETETKL